MAYVKDGKIEFEPTDFYIDYSSGFAQKVLTPAAAAQHVKLRAQLKTEESNRGAEIAAEKARTLAQQRADEKRAQIEAQRKAEAAREAALRARLDEELTAKLKRANPGVSDDEIQAALPEMRKRHQIAQADKAERGMVRQYLAVWNEA